MTIVLKYESIMVSLPSADQVHITRFYRDKKNLGAPVFMLHSTLQDSSTFYGHDGNGLACYLARQGYDVFVADLRGKGKSWPQVNAFSSFGNHQAINEDIPALLEKIVSKRGMAPQIWIGHGWGSVLMCSFYARFGDSVCPVAKMVHFGARRQIQASNYTKTFFISFIWQRLSKLLIAINGYMPAKLLRLGTSNESKDNYCDYLQWSSTNDWHDTVDGFSYGKAIRQQQLPPSFYFAALGDRTYGDLEDVREFVKELGPHDGRLMILSRRGGNLHDYNHLDMLRHKDCEKDHFPLLLDWLQQA
ncbi:MAG: alpha/beta fold hydrolase [Pseudomonadales bacterium]